MPKKVACRHLCQRDLHQNQYVLLTVLGGGCVCVCVCVTGVWGGGGGEHNKPYLREYDLDLKKLRHSNHQTFWMRLLEI